MRDSYCPMPWIGLNILPGSVQPCCQWKGIGEDTTKISNINNANQLPLFVKTRQEMLEGKPIPNCEQCYNAEDAGVSSRRLEVIEQYGRPTDVDLKLLDISFDNVCNLKCRGCTSTASHLWFHDEKNLYGKTISEEKYIDQDFDIDVAKLEYINVSGGEPFLSKKFEMFSKIINEYNITENIHLSISTNGTVFPPESVYTAMVNAKKLSLSISIDGLNDMNEYYRSNSKFSECLKVINYLKNLKELREDNSTHLQIHTTVSVFNVNLLNEIEQYFKENFPQYEYSHRILYWPQQLCIRNLPEDLKDKIRPIVESYDNRYIDVLNELNAIGEDMFDHFLNFNEQLDLLRNESLKDSNPLLSDYIKNYKRKPLNSKQFLLQQMDLLK